MQRLVNKRVLLGVSGGIAAYKSAELIRRLRDAGAEVRVVMTQAAREFITPLTLQALSGHPVHGDLLDPAAEAAMGHIELARWADVVLIAPATADLMARVAQGRGDDLLTTLVLATDARRCGAMRRPRPISISCCNAASKSSVQERVSRPAATWALGACSSRPI